jgi:hypothetical protein
MTSPEDRHMKKARIQKASITTPGMSILFKSSLEVLFIFVK